MNCHFISLIDLEQAAIAQRDISKSMDWTSYYRLQEIYDWLDEMAASYPQYMNVTTIGYSYEKRPIKLVTISKKPVSLKASLINFC
jgi:Zinc carboxypeptidase